MRILPAWLFLFLALSGAVTQSQERRAAAQQRNYPPQFEGARSEVYKQVGDVELRLYVFQPEGQQAADRRAAIVFFFGGGWQSGTPQQFEHQCQALAAQGMVAITADYRVASRHHTKAVACVEDGKSAIRWVRAHAAQLGVDPERIAAGGGSAGGHVAACTGLLTDGDAPAEDATISSRPNALVLFNPAVILAPVEGRPAAAGERVASLQDRLGVEPEKLSPYHHVAAKAPPTLIFHGQADSTVPYATVELFRDAMVKAGNTCELVGYPDAQHGFFNYGRDGNRAYESTTAKMIEFLRGLGYLEGA